MYRLGFYLTCFSGASNTQLICNCLRRALIRHSSVVYKRVLSLCRRHGRNFCLVCRYLFKVLQCTSVWVFLLSMTTIFYLPKRLITEFYDFGYLSCSFLSLFILKFLCPFVFFACVCWTICSNLVFHTTMKANILYVVICFRIKLFSRLYLEYLTGLTSSYVLPN